MKAVLKTESSSDTPMVFKILMTKNVTVLKTRDPFDDCGLIITIEVADRNELNQLLLELNQTSYRGVRLVKICHDSWIDKLFKKDKS